MLGRANGSTRWTVPLFGVTGASTSEHRSSSSNFGYDRRRGVRGVGSSIRASTPTPAALGPRSWNGPTKPFGRGNNLIGTGAQGSSSGLAASSLFVADTVGTGSWNTDLDIVDLGGSPHSPP